MDADEDVLGARDVALDEGDVVLARQHLLVGDRLEEAVRRRQAHRDDALDELLVLAPVLDQVGDRDHQELVPRAVLDQVGDARHRPVVVHDLADDAGGREPREAGEVDGRLGLSRALEDAAVAGAEREDVPGLDEVVRGRARVDRDLDRARAVVRRDPRRDALPRLDRDGEGGAERRRVLIRHLAQAELLAPLRRQAEADEPARVRGHEVDRLGRDELRRDREVALVLAVLVVDDDDEAARADLLDRLLDRREDAAGGLVLTDSSYPGGLSRDLAAARGASSRSTYFASTSTSRLTALARARASASVVSASVCGISATPNESSWSSAIVSDTPSTVIEPFSTQ